MARITPGQLVKNELRRRPVVYNPVLPQRPVLQNQGSPYDFSSIGISNDPTAGPSSDPLNAPQSPNISPTVSPTNPTGAYLPQSPIAGGMSPAEAPSDSGLKVTPVTRPTPTTNELLEAKLSDLMTERAKIAQRPIHTDESKLADTYQGARHAVSQAARSGADPGFLIGAAIGGAARGFFAPSEYEQMKRDRDVAKVDAQVGQVQEDRSKNIESEYKQAQTKNVEAMPADRDAERARKQADADRKDAFNRLTFDFKKEDREKYWEAEEAKRSALERKDMRTYDFWVRKQDEIERANKVRESQTAENEKGRNKRAGLSSGTKTTLAQAKNHQQAASTIESIRSQGAKNNKTDEEIDAAVTRFKNNLPESIRNQLQ